MYKPLRQRFTEACRTGLPSEKLKLEVICHFRKKILKGLRVWRKHKTAGEKVLLLQTLPLEKLDIGNPCNCLLGLTFGHYNTGLTVLGWDTETAEQYGFTLTYSSGWVDESWSLITQSAKEALTLL